MGPTPTFALRKVYFKEDLRRLMVSLKSKALAYPPRIQQAKYLLWGLIRGGVRSSSDLERASLNLGRNSQRPLQISEKISRRLEDA